MSNILNIADSGACVDVATDLYCAGRKEDGVDYIAEIYSIVATLPNGRRYRHPASFPGCDAVQDEEGFWYFGDVREKARNAAEALLRKIGRAGQINLDLWYEDRPVYGSEEYQASGQSMIDAYYERRDDGYGDIWG